MCFLRRPRVSGRALSPGFGHHSLPESKKRKLVVMTDAHDVTLADGPESVITHFLFNRGAKKVSISPR